MILLCMAKGPETPEPTPPPPPVTATNVAGAANTSLYRNKNKNAGMNFGDSLVGSIAKQTQGSLGSAS